MKEKGVYSIATQILALALKNEEARKVVLEKLDARDFPSLTHQKIYYALQMESDPSSIIAEYKLTSDPLWDAALRFPPHLSKLAELLVALKSHSQEAEQIKKLEQLAHNWTKLKPETRTRELLHLFASQTPSMIKLSFQDIQKIRKGLYYLSLPSIKFFPNRYIIIGGRPGVGKTTLIIQMILEVLKMMPHVNILVASLELSPALFGEKTLWVNRHLAGNHSKLPTKEEELLEIESQFLKNVTFIESFFIEDIEDIAISLPPPKLLFVDYVQLMLSRAEFDNRNTELAYISSKLRNISKLPDTSAIVCSQLRRTKTPSLADLRDSGALEADADIVIIIRELTSEELEEIGDSLDNSDKWRKIIVVKDRYDIRQEAIFSFDGTFNPSTGKAGSTGR